jgi:hypothetical protein
VTYYRLEGKTPVPSEWPDVGGDIERSRVGKDVVGESRVSTVFLFIDHQWGEGPPLLFETMVFGGPLDMDCERYSTWEQAEEGHARWVQKVKEAAGE